MECSTERPVRPFWGIAYAIRLGLLEVRESVELLLKSEVLGIEVHDVLAANDFAVAIEGNLDGFRDRIFV